MTTWAVRKVRDLTPGTRLAGHRTVKAIRETDTAWFVTLTRADGTEETWTWRGGQEVAVREEEA